MLLGACLPGGTSLADPVSGPQASTRLLQHDDLGKPGFGTLQLQTARGAKLTAHIYRATRFDPVTGRIWFVMHGAKRNAEDYARAAAPVAERVNALLVVVEFSRLAYPSGSDYTLGVTTHGEPNGRALKEGRWRKPEAYVYSEIERLFDLIKAFLGGEQSGYYLFGHSAGAQFVHRLLTFLPDARVTAAVAANAGWYTLPLAGDSPELTLPYGLGDTPVDEAAVRRLLGRRLTILLGERDTATSEEDSNVRDTREALAQGRNRMERGKNYYEQAGKAAQRLHSPFHWRLALVNKAGHNANEILPSAIPFLFEDAPLLRETSEATPEIIFADIVSDPPAGEAGDLNHDGKRVDVEDQYVTLRNNGQTVRCLIGWTLGDAEEGLRHVFPLGTQLKPGESVMVFGGGIPTGDFEMQVQWARSGQLGLSNAGDTIELRDAAGRLAQRHSW